MDLLQFDENSSAPGRVPTPPLHHSTSIGCHPVVKLRYTHARRPGSGLGSGYKTVPVYRYKGYLREMVGKEKGKKGKKKISPGSDMDTHYIVNLRNYELSGEPRSTFSFHLPGISPLLFPSFAARSAQEQGLAGQGRAGQGVTFRRVGT